VNAPAAPSFWANFPPICLLGVDSAEFDQFFAQIHLATAAMEAAR
jgi:hypothetical protein